MNSAKHIIWLCSGIHLPGGTERANLNAAHLMLQKGYRVTIVVLDESAGSFYPLDPQINLVHRKFFFGIGGKGNLITRKISMLREFYKLKRLLIELKPHVIIATDYPFAVACVVTGLHRKSRVLSWEHHHYGWLKKSWFWNKMIRYAYPRLDSVIVYNKDETAWFEKWGCKTMVIPNFLTELPTINSESQPLILTVGWLIERKGVDMIPAMAEKILDKHPQWKWKVIGEGELEKQLRKEIAERGLQNRLIIQKPEHPLQANDYQQASVYVMTSRQEPFGLVLIEAMSNGVPCIAYNCETGPRHIIQDNEDGYLVPAFDTSAMEYCILKMIKDAGLRKQFGIRAKSNVKKFSADAVWLKWKILLE